jgi:hypothetical protein
MTEKIYRGTPGDGPKNGGQVWVIPADAQPYLLKHVVFHSPTGFSWGYGGSGPADLALSILADHFGENPTENDLYHGRPRSWQLHQPFKWRFIANLPMGDIFELHSTQIERWLADQAPRKPQTSDEGVSNDNPHKNQENRTG